MIIKGNLKAIIIPKAAAVKVDEANGVSGKPVDVVLLRVDFLTPVLVSEGP